MTTSGSKQLLRGVMVVVVLIATVPVALLAYVVAREWLFEAKFNGIDAGMSEAEVIGRLGQPSERGTQFRLGQYKGFEAEYRRAATTASQRYLFWIRADVVYTIGFNEKSEVTIRSRGGT